MSVSEFAGVNSIAPGLPISASSGYMDASLLSPYGIVIDPSGHVWTADNDAGEGQTVTELLGAAATVKKPLLCRAQLP